MNNIPKLKFKYLTLEETSEILSWTLKDTDNILSVSLSVHDSISDVSSRVKYLNFNFGMLFIFPPI